MKRWLLTLGIMFALAAPANAADQWAKTEPLGTRSVSDIDAYVSVNNAALDRLLINHVQGPVLKYNSAASVTVAAGTVACSNSGGTVVRYRYNSSDTNSVWTVGEHGLDAGSEASSTTYYVYAECDTDETGFNIKLSTNSSAPSGVTYYKKLGTIYNNSSSNIEQVANTDVRSTAASGTVANGATISLPSGWAQDECDWAAFPITYTMTSQIDVSLVAFSGYASTSRVATCSGQAWTGVPATVTCGYIISCYR